MKGVKHRKQVLRAKRLFFAESSFGQARALAKYAQENDLGKCLEIFVPIMSGIVVIYARPFMRADGLGELDKKFESFSDNIFQSTHDTMMKTRHEMAAHRDLVNTVAVNPDGSDHHMFTVNLNFDGRGSYTYGVVEPYYRDINLPKIISLCDHQIARVNKDSHNTIDQLNKGRRLKAGTYVLGDDFP